MVRNYTFALLFVITKIELVSELSRKKSAPLITLAFIKQLDILENVRKIRINETVKAIIVCLTRQKHLFHYSGVRLIQYDPARIHAFFNIWF